MAKVELSKRNRLAVAGAAWYNKRCPTFADALAAVRREIWGAQGFPISRSRPDSRKLTQRLGEGIIHGSATPHDDCQMAKVELSWGETTYAKGNPVYRLSGAYQSRAVEIAGEKLEKAGCRLAMMLTRALQ